MEKHYCEECEKDIAEETSLELVSKRKLRGVGTSETMEEFCSFGCIEDWINRRRREVTRTTERENGRVRVTFWSYELQRYLGSWEVHEEKGKLCVKPEVWDELIKD